MLSPSNIWCWDLNPRPLEHELSLITTRPGLLQGLSESLLASMISKTLLFSAFFAFLENFAALEMMPLQTVDT